MAQSSSNDNGVVIAEFLGEKQKEVVVQPNEFLIVVRDGAFTVDGSLDPASEWDIIRTEGKHVLRQGGMFAPKRSIRSLLANGSLHSFSFWTVSPDEVDLSAESGHSLPVLSKDGMVIPMHVTVIIAVDQDNATKLFRLAQLRTTQRFTTGDLREMLRTEVMANVIVPTIASYQSSEVRGNENVRSELLARLRDTCESYFEWYGIGLAGNKLAIQWGLTEADAYHIKAQRLAWEQALRPSEPSHEPPDKTPVEAPATGINFANTGQIGGGVTIEQKIQGGIHVAGPGEKAKTRRSVWGRAIVIFGTIGALGSGTIFVLRLINLL